MRRVRPRLHRTRRFLLLSDTHLRPFSYRTYHRVQRAARWAASEGATHALIAGDLLEDDREAETVARLLRRALGPLEAWYVSGNHEAGRARAMWPYRRNDRSVIAAAMAGAGIALADDRLVDLDGIPLLGIGWRGLRTRPGPGTLARLGQADGPALVLAHSPDHVRGLPPGRVLLALCGHTHGGQVRLPVIGAPWTPVRAALPRLAGAMSIGGVAAYVSRGIGATIPVRLGSVPEATLVEIGPATDGITAGATKLVIVRERD